MVLQRTTLSKWWFLRNLRWCIFHYQLNTQNMSNHNFTHSPLTTKHKDMWQNGWWCWFVHVFDFGHRGTSAVRAKIKHKHTFMVSTKNVETDHTVCTSCVSWPTSRSSTFVVCLCIRPLFATLGGHAKRQLTSESILNKQIQEENNTLTCTSQRQKKNKLKCACTEHY